MKKLHLLCLLSCFCLLTSAQQIQLQEIAPVNQAYGTQMKSENLLPMNYLDMDTGYVLYEAEVETSKYDAVLEVENVRDYAVVYADNLRQGILTNEERRMTLSVAPGHYILRIYAVNTGHTPYRPEIEDHSKGLSGYVLIDGTDILNWKMTELITRNLNVNELSFTPQATSDFPCFHKGSFQVNNPLNCYLDVSGWGMGKVWINGKCIGSYREQEEQQSIQVPSSVQVVGKNDVVVLEIKNNEQKKMRLTNYPIVR